MKGLESKLVQKNWCNKFTTVKISCILKRYDGTIAHVLKATEKT